MVQADTFGDSNLGMHVHDGDFTGELVPASWSPSEEYRHLLPTGPGPWLESSEYVRPEPVADPIYLPSEPGSTHHYAQPLDYQSSNLHARYAGPACFEPQLYAWPPPDGAEAAFNSTYLQPSFIPPRAVHSRTTRPLASSHYTPCAWGSQCSVPLDDLTPAGVARHLKEHHFRDPSKPWHPKNRGHCEWWEADGQCNKDLNYASFGKHVAAVHLQSTAKACPHCFQSLGRADSLERHIKNYCSRSGRCEKK